MPTLLPCPPAAPHPAALQLRGVLEGGARRLVSELVARHWTLAALDSLPYGVALPLRQALHQCRSNPPGGWPREAYVLIGGPRVAGEARGGWPASEQGTAAACCASWFAQSLH